MSHVARCRYHRRSPPDAAQAHLLAPVRDPHRHLRRCRDRRRVAPPWHRCADGAAGRIDRAHQHQRPHPQRPGTGRGAGASRKVARSGGDRARQQSWRHHVRLRGTARLLDAAQGEEAARRRGRRAGGVGRLYHCAGGRPYHRVGNLVGGLDRSAVSISQRGRSLEDARDQDRGNQVVAAQGGPKRFRADLARGARRRRVRSCRTPMRGSRAWSKRAVTSTMQPWSG